MRRTAGRLVQMMPVLISIVDQSTNAHWSQVGFVVLANVLRDLSRRIEMSVTL